MTRPAAFTGRSRSLLASLIALIATLALVALMSNGSAQADHPAYPAVPAPPTSPTRADQIQNLGQVTSAIKAYYGDTVSGTIPDGSPLLPGETNAQHLPSPTGAYAKEVAGVEAQAGRYLDHFAAHSPNAKMPAIVLDVDDTSVNTYNYEIYSHFAYNPTTNSIFVNAGFPAVFGMPALAQAAAAKGYAVFFLTGRPESQRAATDANLTSLGYPVTDSQVYLKDLTKPIYASCYSATPPTPPTCTTIQYKSLTRAYIESLGYDIVANFGDQYSDLSGGYANKTFKLPNPMYYLP